MQAVWTDSRGQESEHCRHSMGLIQDHTRSIITNIISNFAVTEFPRSVAAATICFILQGEEPTI